MMTAEINAALTDYYNGISKQVTPGTWICNFKDGASISSKQLESFNDLSLKEKEDLTAMRLQIEEKTLTISRRVGEGSRAKIIPGFFFHIKEGRMTLVGKYPGFKTGFFAERIGFCFSREGFADTIRIDHSNYFQVLTDKINRVEMLIDQHKMKTVDEVSAHKSIVGLIECPINYPIDVQPYRENILENRVNIGLFGTLDDLPSIEDSDISPPRLLDDFIELDPVKQKQEAKHSVLRTTI